MKTRACARCGFRPRKVSVETVSALHVERGRAPIPEQRLAVVVSPLCRECEREELEPWQE